MRRNFLGERTIIDIQIQRRSSEMSDNCLESPNRMQPLSILTKLIANMYIDAKQIQHDDGGGNDKWGCGV